MPKTDKIEELEEKEKIEKVKVKKETIPIIVADMVEIQQQQPHTPPITAFLEIFEEKLKKTIQRIKKEMDKKNNGNGYDKNQLKKMVKEAKALKKNVKKARDSKFLTNSGSSESDFTCPHCGESIKL